MSDGRIEPSVSGLFHGVSRQAPLQRAPEQLQDLENYVPSVDIGGLVDRAGTRMVFALDKASYASAGPHHFFRTTDGQRWVLLRRTESGNFEVRNADTGAPASVTIPTNVKGYLGQSGGALRMLTIADTTLICNTAVTVAASEAPEVEKTTAFIYIKRMSSANQAWWVNASYVECVTNNRATREHVADALTQMINSGRQYINIEDDNRFIAGPVTNPNPGLTAIRVGTNPSVVQVTGSPAQIDALFTRNTWDADAMVFIKHRVSATADLPPALPESEPIKVDLGHGDVKKAYYVQYDLGANAYIERSYLVGEQATATLDASTMPVKMRQTGDAAFTFELCEWTPRMKGDSESNPLPFFVGKKVSDLATWKGRLILASEDTLCISQADELFNYFKETARESRPSDPIELPTDSPDLSVIYHVVAFRSKLIVTAENAQLEVPGDKPLTPENADIAVVTRYALDKDCRPSVIGDSLYYTGTVAGRSALWEYAYDNDSASNVAFDLSKHVPGFVPGRVSRIVGSSQAGRLYMLAPSDPNALFTQTSYWKDNGRVQNAWGRLRFPGLTVVRDVWIDEGFVVLLGESTTHLFLLRFPVDADLGADPANDQRLDFRVPVTGTWDSSYTRYTMPPGFASLGVPTLTVMIPGDTWVTEFTGTVVGSEFRVPTAVPAGSAWLGVKYPRSMEFSPFYMRDGDKNVAVGRLQVKHVTVDLLRTGDFTATVSRNDRGTMSVQRSARVVGEARARPIVGENLHQRVPFNAQGDKARLTLTADSTAPSVITGYSMAARYTNPLSG